MTAPQPFTDAEPSTVTTSQARDALTHEKFCHLSNTASPAERQLLRDEVVLLHKDVAESIACRYRQRGAETDDLMQVAHEGLVKAVDRFDVSSGHHFLSFAVPTITGEVRRYFRDCCWAIRPTRRVQELQHAIARCSPALTQQLHRSPTPQELAEELKADQDDVQEALACDGYFNVASLDMPTGWEEGARRLADDVGEHDQHLDWVENHEQLSSVLGRLSDREQRLLYLRFEQDWKQSDIAADLGISQMQVSRLLNGLLRRLRQELADSDSGRDSAA
jgi:RNA polymerase sigma-B factor